MICKWMVSFSHREAEDVVARHLTTSPPIGSVKVNSRKVSLSSAFYSNLHNFVRSAYDSGETTKNKNTIRKSQENTTGTLLVKFTLKLEVKIINAFLHFYIFYIVAQKPTTESDKNYPNFGLGLVRRHGAFCVFQPVVILGDSWFLFIYLL